MTTVSNESAEKPSAVRQAGRASIASQKSASAPTAKTPVMIHPAVLYPGGKYDVNTPISSAAKTTPPTRTHAIHVSRSRRKSVRRSLIADVLRRDQGVSLEEATVIPRNVQTRVARAEIVVVHPQPVDERYVRLAVDRNVAAPLLDTAVPRTDVLADVAAIHLRAELCTVCVGHRLCGLRPIRETLRRVERARLVERARRAGVDAEAARPAVEVERRRRLDLHVGDERAEHDPRTVRARDHQRVLAIEADTAARRRLAVDVLIRVDEDAVLAAEFATERVEL